MERSRRARHGDWVRHRDDIRHRRAVWERHYHAPVRRYNPWRHDHNHWAPRYDRWWHYHPRPIYIVVPGHIWIRPMPDYGHWDYFQVELIAQNLEDLSFRIYSVMSAPEVPYRNPSYRPRLMDALLDLAGAAQNYSDSVSDSYDWNESIYDLFYLEEQLSQVEQTLDGFSQAYRVTEEMRYFRYYVDELLWQYRYYY